MRLLFWVLGSNSEMQKQRLPVWHWRHWLSVGDPTEITHVSSVTGFQVHAWWGRAVSHGQTELMCSDGSKLPTLAKFRVDKDGRKVVGVGGVVRIGCCFYQ